MKKLLSMLGAISLIGTASTSVIACGGGETPKPKPEPSPTPKQKIDISTKISNSIDLGQLSTNTKQDFLNKLEDKLKTMSGLTTITTSDYDVYKAGTTNEIQNSDIIVGNSLNIKITTTKGSNFEGIKDNIVVNYIQKDTRIDISTKISNSIDLGQLSTNTKQDFLNKLEDKLKTMSGLTTITTSDYDVYKAGTTNEIQNSDIIVGNSLNIKITTTKGSNFEGIKDNIVVNYIQKDTRIDIFNKIPNSINLGKLSAKTKIDFLAKVQEKLVSISGLESITASDYDVYKYKKEDTTILTTIQNSDIENQNLLDIKIVAKGNNFKGYDYTTFEYNQQNTIYIWNSDEYSTNAHDLNDLKININKIIQIGYFENEKGEFQAVKMPKAIKKVPNQLPSEITSLQKMFEGASSFNQDISSWDTSKITNMNQMFSGASSFNQNLSKWNVSNVTDMAGMFWIAEKFNGNISSWDTSKVTNMSAMFKYALKFNQDISFWDTSKVRDMGEMFKNDLSFNQDLSKWNVSNVTNMAGMFESSINFNQDISSWDTSKVTYMISMFQHALKFNQNISSWDTSKVTNMTFMFQGASQFNQDISNWDVSNVKEHVNFAGNSGITDPNKLPNFKN